MSAGWRHLLGFPGAACGLDKLSGLSQGFAQVVLVLGRLEVRGR